MKFIQGFVFLSLFTTNFAFSHVIYDKSRDRNIPVEVSYPHTDIKCSELSKCPVVFISAGYGVEHTKYSFLTNSLNRLGYMVISIAHELSEDPPLSIQGDLYKTRSENWIRGAKTLDFVRDELKGTNPNYDFNSLVLVGHSNGGDISAWLANEKKTYIKTVITLDNRRVPLPLDKKIGVLSIRGSDFLADEGVLPTDNQKTIYQGCIVQIPNSRHNDMSDYGPNWLKEKMSLLVTQYLQGASCVSLESVPQRPE
ncbi:MAG: alpha/beta hydrolase [Shewanella oncorhynchi]